jgi:predicted glycosyltransferase
MKTAVISREISSAEPVPEPEERRPAMEALPPLKVPNKSSRPMKIWIDLENSPHVPFFRPILKLLEAQGHRILLTGRDAYQVRELVAFHNLPCQIIGRHYGKNKIAKVGGILFRCCQMLPLVLDERPDLSVSHGSRTSVLLSRALGIPSVGIFDYEFTSSSSLMSPNWKIVPSALTADDLKGPAERLLQYPGIKEDVYVPFFEPDSSMNRELGFQPDDLIVTIRPPATEAHYHNQESEPILDEVMRLVGADARTRTVLVPRNARQAEYCRQRWPELFASGKVMIPAKVVDGLNLIWQSDLVISGGGTMNREAAALGVPVYSIFRGKTGAVDRELVRENRLIMIENVEQVRSKITLARRSHNTSPDRTERPALKSIVGNILRILEQECHTAKNIAR